MLHDDEIAFLFMSFKRLRLEREQIRQILLAITGLETIGLWHEFHIRKSVLKRAERDFLPASNKIAMSLKYYLRI